MVNKVQVSPMACSFFNKNDWQNSTAGSFIKKNLANRVWQTSKQKRYGTCEQVNSFICIHKVFSPETQKRGHVSQFCWDQKNWPNYFPWLVAVWRVETHLKSYSFKLKKNAPRWATTIFINGIMGLQKKRPYKWLSLKAFHFSAYRSAGKKRPPSPGEIFTWFSNASRHRCRSGRSTSRLGLAISSHMEWWRTSLEYEICT